MKLTFFILSLLLSVQLYAGIGVGYSKTTLKLTVNPSNSGTKSGAGTYNYGSNITVNATANTGYTFTNWTENGTVVSTGSSYRFALTGNRTLVANFTPIQYTIAKSNNPTVGGTSSGAGTYNYGSNITLNAIANTGYSFTNWTESGTIVSTNPSYRFTVTGSRTLVANFTPIQYTIATSSNPAAGGTSTGAGKYNPGNSVTLNATANTGYTFSNWTESGTIVSTNQSYKFTAGANRTFVANFTPIQYTIAKSNNPTAGGTSSGAGTYNYGSNITLTATPKSGFTFANWTESGTIVSTSSSYRFTVTGNRTLVANFSAILGKLAWNSGTLINRANDYDSNDPGNSIASARQLPENYELSQNYPNPFNPETVINYQIPIRGLVTLKVYDSLGKLITTLVNKVQEADTYTISFNGNHLSSGIYFYKIESGNYSSVKKMLVLK
jgi:uncharacterized repeat protein (TIGR02543 family)